MGRKNKTKLNDHSKCQEEIRKLKIIALLAAVNYKTLEERFDAVESFNHANLTIEEIQKLVEPLIKHNQNIMEFNRRTGVF